MTWRPSPSTSRVTLPDTRRSSPNEPSEPSRIWNNLEQFPRSGRIVPEIRHDDIREVILQSYRIIYRVHPDEVEILTIHHGARLLDRFERPV